MKYKHCHGFNQPQQGQVSAPLSSEHIQAVLRKREAIEFQRQRQQGRGRPVISVAAGGSRHVAVGNATFSGKWRTFTEFLLGYAKSTLGLPWGQAELKKPFEEQHPYIQWCAALSELIEIHRTADPDGLYSMPAYGAAYCVYGLAYDLYLIEHHARTEKDAAAFQRLLVRLRQKDQFYGARHETKAAGILLRAGFEIEWEDEDDRRSGRHGEFIATFPASGRKYWVECKMRQPEQFDGSVRFTHLVSDALKKQTDLERLVFVELNHPDGCVEDASGGWPGIAINQLRNLEQQPSSAALPSALVLISNFPEHHRLRELPSGGMLLEGFKTEWFRLGQEVELLEAIDRKHRTVEVESLFQSIREHSTVPATFDGSIPGIDDSRRLLIGAEYEVDGVSGILEEAIVVPEWRQAVGFLRLPDERRVQVRLDLTENELHAWKQHPETFFGELRPHNPPAKNPMDLYEFFFSSYKDTPREKLLEFMASHEDIEQLRTLNQPELAKQYAYRTAVAVCRQSEWKAEKPLWQQRLRRVIRNDRK